MNKRSSQVTHTISNPSTINIGQQKYRQERKILLRQCYTRVYGVRRVRGVHGVHGVRVIRW